MCCVNGGSYRCQRPFVRITMIDVSWLLPIEVGTQSFVFMGHAEFLGGRTSELGEDGSGVDPGSAAVRLGRGQGGRG